TRSTTMARLPTPRFAASSCSTAPHLHRGPGFAQYVIDHRITAKDISDGEQHEGGWSWAAFDNGLVLFWSEATGMRDNMAGEVAVRLCQKPPQIIKEPVVPPSVHEALTTCSQFLAPFLNAANEINQSVKDLAA